MCVSELFEMCFVWVSVYPLATVHLLVSFSWFVLRTLDYRRLDHMRRCVAQLRSQCSCLRSSTIASAVANSIIHESSCSCGLLGSYGWLLSVSFMLVCVCVSVSVYD
jgi:hypothetical protein